MNKTQARACEHEKLLVTLDELAGILSCGLETAKKIGEYSEARFEMGRRVLWNVAKVKAYIDRESY